MSVMVMASGLKQLVAKDDLVRAAAAAQDRIWPLGMINRLLREKENGETSIRPS